jgi:hypothetical protein
MVRYPHLETFGVGCGALGRAEWSVLRSECRKVLAELSTARNLLDRAAHLCPLNDAALIREINSYLNEVNEC